MGQKESPDCNAPILLDVGGDIGDKRRIPDLPPAVQLSLVSGLLALLRVLDDGVNLSFFKLLSPYAATTVS
jgi:hypothetical protein